ncbi:ribosome biogenesis GTP-binding protein YihA/YsxC [Roseospira navarrensis]|uniref:Probable GTP-binding protein EngB n=1 Tax=Roseospira navarrensis TaxID=140058 RepID=A0A7X1ZBD1_9PROT|nr:ribosome biogenesis GTP-binding protein YihA/YsxC [Roseospira navarrensis]MQX35411.1 YihA family ribosome biogenesis GTP-binding protein [Roseospira navarrensis]
MADDDPGAGGADPEAAARVETGRVLFAQPCAFLKGVADLSGLPASDLPEIAFCGRSNVGKSSLVNALTGRKTLARTSNTPGRTQEINLFYLGPEGTPRLMLADLPGHGFARAPKAKVDAWTRLVNAYLKGRPPLRRVLLLVDSRHGLKAVDRTVMGMLDGAAVNYQVVLTKADKPASAAVQRVHEATRAALAEHVAAHPDVLVTSSETGAGLPDLRAALGEIALPA